MKYFERAVPRHPLCVCLVRAPARHAVSGERLPTLTPHLAEAATLSTPMAEAEQAVEAVQCVSRR